MTSIARSLNQRFTNQMNVALAGSLAAHLVLLGVAAGYSARRAGPIWTEPQIVNVSLVSLGAPPPGRGAKPPSGTPAPAPAKAKQALPKKDVPDVRETASRKTRPKKKPAPNPKKEATAAAPAAETEASPALPGVGEVRLDASNFQFSYYLAALKNKIGAYWSPGSAGGSATPLKTVIHFQISRRGAIEEARVETSSGNGFFDQSALRAVLAASPLGPLPPEFPGGNLGVHFEFCQTP